MISAIRRLLCGHNYTETVFNVGRSPQTNCLKCGKLLRR